MKAIFTRKNIRCVIFISLWGKRQQRNKSKMINPGKGRKLKKKTGEM